MIPRYLRFARTVALVTSASTTGCHADDPATVPAPTDSGALAQDTAPPDALAPDARASDSAVSDATDALDAEDAHEDGALDVTAGGCRELILDGGREIGCDAGSTCSFPETDSGDADPLLCTYGIDAAAPEGGIAPCGVITCGANCYCAGPAISLCGCLHLGFSGPLPPPTLRHPRTHERNSLV